MDLHQGVLEILACPKCKGDIKFTDKATVDGGKGLICKNCKLLYPIRDGISVLLIDEAIKIGET